MLRMTKSVLATILSALLFVFSFPTVIAGVSFPSSGYLAWIAFVPFLIVIRHATLRRVWFLSFLFFVLFFLCQLATIETAVRVFGGFSWFVSLPLTVLLVMALSVFMAFVPWLSLLLSRKRGEWIVWFPVCYASFEFFRITLYPFGGFPWGELAATQVSFLLPLQITDLAGSVGLTFVIAWVNLFFAEMFCFFNKESISSRRQKIIVTSLLLLFCFGYGAIRISKLDNLIHDMPSLKVALLQGNVVAGARKTTETALRDFEVYLKSAASVSKTNVELIVWPEAAYPFVVPLQKPVLYGSLFDRLSTSSLPFSLLGAVTQRDAKYYYNSALLYDAKGNLHGMYHKTHLVPFGEYIPYRALLPFLSAVTQPKGILLAGEKIEPLQVGPLSIGPLVCVEDLYPSISREHVRQGANLLVNITNDAWYGISPIPEEHLAYSVLRAVETRRSLLRAANSGVTAIIDPLGRVLQRTPLREKALLVDEVPLMSIKSSYVMLGNWFAWGCVLYLFFGVVFLFKDAMKTKS